MSTPPNANCPRCGTALPDRAPEGLCPRCLGALNLVTETVPTGSETPTAPQPSLTPAELAPHFPQLEILECLGRGGMGVVYKARQKSLGRFVALKLLAPERVTDPGFADRFTREAQALARLSHPNIVTIHDFGVTPARAGDFQSPPPPPQTLDPRPQTPFYFLLMEFVDGVNLRQAMKAGRFTPEQALAIVPPVCEALQYAHEHGIVHRDIKPENLLLDKTGRVKIADFGIAKMLGGGDTPVPASQFIGETGDRSVPLTLTAAGTPQYMAPEQREHHRTDHRADIYSLGVVLYELLTGELPSANLQPPSRKVQIDVRLDEVVLRALETKPELRYATAAEFRTQLEHVRETPAGQRREDSGEKIEKSPAPPPLSSTLSPLSSSAPKTANAYLSTPEWLASLRGPFWVYSGKGTLVLTGDQLAFTDTQNGTHTTIPLTAIRDVSLGNYPWFSKPVPLHYVSVTWEEAGQTHCRYFTPNQGWFCPVWETNPIVRDWHQSLRAAVTAATGKAPAETPTPPHRPTLREGALMGLMFGMPVVVVGAAFFILKGVFASAHGGNAQPTTWLLPGLALLAAVIPFLTLFFLSRRSNQTGGTPISEPSEPSGVASPKLAWVVVPVLIVAALLLLLSPNNGRLGILGFPEAIILAVLGGLGFWRWRQRPAVPASESGRGRNFFGVGLICLGMFIGGLKIQDVSRRHVQQVHAMAAEIPLMQQQWLAAGNEVFAANTKLSRHIGQEPLARTDAERQRHAIEQGRLEGEVSKAKVRQDVINGQIRTTQDRLAATPFPFAEAAALVFAWSLPFVLAGVLVLCWPRRGATDSKPVGWKYSGLLMLFMPVLLLVFLFLQFRAQVTSRAGVTLFETVPVGVSNNVVIVDVTAEVAHGNLELHTVLAGPPLPRETEAALADAFFPPFAGTFIKPLPHAGNHPWRILSPGRHTVRLGFVLPDAALAQQAAANLRPIGPLPAESGRTFAGTLFEVQQTNGPTYRASLQLGPPRTAADPDWVSLSGQFTDSGTSCRLTWEILASQPGAAHFRREGNSGNSSLQLDPKTKLHRLAASLELTRVSTNRVRLVTKKGYSSHTEEMNGNFRELADELRSSKALSAKTVLRVPIGLCRVKGQPLTVTVEPASPRPAATGNASQFPLSFGFSFGFIALGAILIVGFGGVAMLVWMLRKGGASKRVVLLVFGIPLLLAAVGLAALIGYKATGGMSFEKFQRMQLHNDYQTHPGPNPPGRVQQTQNGFRLQLPAGQLATFELLLKQADDSLQPIPALTALVAAGTNTAFNDRLYWTLRRLGTENASEYWSWSVTAHDGSGRALPQLTDHGTNLSHVLAPGETLDWWQLNLPTSFTFGAGEEKMIPLFRTHSTATTTGQHPKEGWLRVRCAALPTGFVTNGTPRIELGLAAHALLATQLPAATRPESQLVLDTVPINPRDYPEGAKPALLTWKFKCLIPADHMAQIVFVRSTNGVPTVVEGMGSYYKVGKAPVVTDFYISHDTNGPTKYPEYVTRWDVNLGLVTATQFRPVGPVYRQLATAARTSLRPGQQLIVPLAEFTDTESDGRGNQTGVELRILLEPLRSPAVQTVPTEKDYGTHIGATGLALPLAEVNALLNSIPKVTTAPVILPSHIEFKALRVENPPGTRDILLHFERDTHPGLGLEVSQDVTPSPGLRKQPAPGTHRDWQVKTWVGVNDRVLAWTLPPEFTAAEVRAVAKDLEQRAKAMRQLPDGAVPEFATAVHRDGWKYHLIARVKPDATKAAPAAAYRASPNSLKLERRITSAKPGWMWLKDGGEKPFGQQLQFDPADGLYHGGVVVCLEKSEGHQVGPEIRARLGYGFAGMSTPWATVTSAHEFEDGATAFRQQVAKLNSAPLPVPMEGEFVELIRLQDAVVALAVTAEQAAKPKRVFTPEEVLQEQPAHVVTVAFRVAEAYWISGAVPVGAEPSFGLAPSEARDASQHFSVLIVGQLVKDAGLFGIDPTNPGSFFKGREIEVTGLVQKFPAAKGNAAAKPSFSMTVTNLENFRVIK